jgi:Ni2+-binding GTPase involved in maturation of urease and hydrogenase
MHMKLILTGGFLGSGKTTAIVQACQHLMAEGKKVAVITNDQGNQQVDSAFTKGLGINTREVSNGCFCCRYNELDAHLQSLEAESHPEIVFAESVGSCTDLVATLVTPLLHFKPDIKIIVCVFADASLLASLIEGRSSFLEESVRYIYKKQLEESDSIILNKIDLVSEQQLSLTDNVLRTEYPGKTIIHQNSLRQDDVVKWLSLLNQFAPRGKRDSLNLDYDLYGNGEAQLAWLDKSIIIQSPMGNGGFIARQIIRSIFNQLQQKNLTIGHLKFFLETDQWSEKVSFTTATSSADFKIPNGTIHKLKLLINARVQADANALQALIDNVLDQAKASGDCLLTIVQHSSFTPGPPTPTHRM